MNNGAILLVEDNPDDVQLTLRAFKQHNLTNEIIVARDGAEAEELLFGEQRKIPVPSLILLDLKLSKLNGLEVLKSLREHTLTALVPVVILTSSVEEEDIISAYESGANSYIRKPVDFSDFVAAIKQVGMYWLLVNQPPPGPRP
jgi:DNA-binding response OmpR family regulator